MVTQHWKSHGQHQRRIANGAASQERAVFVCRQQCNKHIPPSRKKWSRFHAGSPVEAEQLPLSCFNFQRSHYRAGCYCHSIFKEKESFRFTNRSRKFPQLQLTATWQHFFLQWQRQILNCFRFFSNHSSKRIVEQSYQQETSPPSPKVSKFSCWHN